MKFDFDATGAGSLPFKDAQEACRVVFDNFKTIPFWPQLPRRTFLEHMYVQFSERLPGAVVDEAAKTIHIDTNKVAGEIEQVYEKYLDGDIDFFRISEDRAQGLYRFLESLDGGKNDIKFVKGHVTGPISFALFLTDQNKKSVIYDKDLFEVLSKLLVMKTRWQIKKLKEKFPRVIIFIDEPYLVSIGSSFVNVNMEDAGRKLDELIGAVKEAGALCGVHCCGNTDWSYLLKRGIDILNFDTYNFMKEFLLYTSDIKNFLAGGGTIAWGIIPTSDGIDRETKKSLVDRLKDDMALLAAKGVERDALSSIVTPSCGLGVLDEDRARRIVELVRKVSNELG
ncbi:MAG: hypothetical protein WC515_08110 [Candidatus Omnitrophota bacterium]